MLSSLSLHGHDWSGGIDEQGGLQELHNIRVDTFDTPLFSVHLFTFCEMQIDFCYSAIRIATINW
jgi:hypothetical protein